MYLNIKQIKLSDLKFLFQVNESNRHIEYFLPLIKYRTNNCFSS